MSMYDALNQSLGRYRMSGLDKLLTNEEAGALVRATISRKPDHVGSPEEGGVSTYNLSTLDLTPELRESISKKLKIVRERAANEDMSTLRKITTILRAVLK